MGSDSPKRVLLLGWDGADWKHINPLIDAGELPVLKRLIEGGVMGNIQTLEPVFSPMLWTSIATGMRADVHGIHGFIEPMPDGKGSRPFSALSRRVKALWNMTTQVGLRTHQVGWWASHPAEPIDGCYVSNAYQHMKGPPEPRPEMQPETVHPQRLHHVLADLRVHPRQIETDHMRSFLADPHLIDSSTPEMRRMLQSLAKVISDTASMHNAATWLLEHEPWDFAAIYYEAIDHFCHGWMAYHPPCMPEVPEELYNHFHPVIKAAYRLHDLMLGRLLELAGDDVTLVLVSDHGFHCDHLRPKYTSHRPAGPAIWHRDHGILLMHGPGIRADERIYGASLLDITPTVLTLMGLPVGEDMPGKVLVDAFETPPTIERIPSWELLEGECGMHPPDKRQDPVDAHAALQQLIDLGYVEPVGGNLEKAASMAARESKYNLSRVYLDSGRAKLAIPMLQELVKESPQVDEFKQALARAYMHDEQPLKASQLLMPLLGKGIVGAQAATMLGMLLLGDRQYDRALHLLKQAEQVDFRLPTLHNTIGRVYLAQRKWAEAEQAFRRALEIDEDSPPGHRGLAVALLRLKRPKEAVEHALTTIGLDHHQPRAHLLLGQALLRLGWLERAAQAFEVCLKMRPRWRRVHRYLASVYRRLGRVDEAVAQLERLAELPPEPEPPPAAAAGTLGLDETGSADQTP